MWVLWSHSNRGTPEGYRNPFAAHLCSVCFSADSLHLSSKKVNVPTLEDTSMLGMSYILDQEIGSVWILFQSFANCSCQGYISPWHIGPLISYFQKEKKEMN